MASTTSRGSGESPTHAARQLHAGLPSTFLASDGQACVDIQLDPDLLAAFARRGRRRLRDLQKACDVALHLDKARSTLQVTGAPAGIAAVRRQLAGLTGPRRSVSPAVWAELMRTRTVQSGDQGTVMRIQEECGCRVHIERSRQEIRLFGVGESVALADRLLEELAERAKQEAVPVSNFGELVPGALQALAHACSVSLCVEAQRVVVLGLIEKVDAAVAEVHAYLADPSKSKFKAAGDSLPTGDDGRSLDSEKLSSSGSSGRSHGLVYWEPDGEGLSTESSLPPLALQAGGASSHASSCEFDRRGPGSEAGSGSSGRLGPESAGSGRGSHGSHGSHGVGSEHSGHLASEPCTACFQVCPTCGVGRFCPGCGARLPLPGPPSPIELQLSGPGGGARSPSPSDELPGLPLPLPPVGGTQVATTAGAQWSPSLANQGTPDENAAWLANFGCMPQAGSIMVPMMMMTSTPSNGMLSPGLSPGSGPAMMQTCVLPANVVGGGCMVSNSYPFLPAPPSAQKFAGQ